MKYRGSFRLDASYDAFEAEPVNDTESLHDHPTHQIPRVSAAALPDDDTFDVKEPTSCHVRERPGVRPSCRKPAAIPADNQVQNMPPAVHPTTKRTKPTTHFTTYAPSSVFFGYPVSSNAPVPPEMIVSC